jgi:hypothetical protein
MKEKRKPEKRAMKAASDARENSSYIDDTTNILIGENVWKYFEKRGYSDVITRAEKKKLTLSVQRLKSMATIYVAKRT